METRGMSTLNPIRIVGETSDEDRSGVEGEGGDTGAGGPAGAGVGLTTVAVGPFGFAFGAPDRQPDASMRITLAATKKRDEAIC